ncbi:methyl-accepting chemotaxis protein [Thiomicrospira microaerophila]|uniref:methyl-accepting chemotaxis protein n=1 Tax=Thiomicrospira microaerophila TaxID=406020 RepID=UPI000697520C|nr:methyl-accepting chemotaxis protein [Thiomicrospira microaerophila]
MKTLYYRYLDLSLFSKILLPLGFLIVIGSLISFDRMQALKNDALHAAGENAALSMIAMAKNSRTFYVDEVVPKATQAGLALSHNYKTHPTNLPLAANVMIALGEMSAAQGGDLGQVKLFSDQPFKFRGAVKLDEFEKQALAQLAKNPDQPYIQVETINGSPFFRLAVPDLMSQASCVACHNSHPDSPKTDWKIGDVRGVLSASIPLASLEQAIATPVKQTTFSFALLALVFIVLMLLTAASIRQRVKRLADSMIQVDRSGRLETHIQFERSDEIDTMGRVFSTMLGNMNKAVTETNRVVSAMAQGQFDQRIESDLKGDLATMKDGVNLSMDEMSQAMVELNATLNALKSGNFSYRSSLNLKGDYKQMIDNASSAMSSLDQTIGAILTSMDALNHGEFDQRIDLEAQGALAELKSGINQAMHNLSQAVVDITRLTLAQSQGDLSERIEHQYHGQLAIVGNAINQNADKLVEVISGATQASNMVSSAADEVNSASEHLSQRVQEQAAATEQSSASIRQMSEALKISSQRRGQTAQMAEKVQDQVVKSTEAMNQTIEAMRKIQASSEKIAEIVSLIDGIAFQTNLLALNAAVEAARAGEHGRGFAVVAGEVRALSQKSAEAAKDIKQLIDNSTAQINQGTRLAAESGELLKGVDQAMIEVSGSIKRISQISTEQSNTISQVETAINEIDSITQQNAAYVEQTSAAAESLKDQAVQLKQDLDFFKVITQKPKLIHRIN